MTYKIDFKEKVILMRKSGHSIAEVVKKFGISKSTSSLWLRSIILDKNALRRLQEHNL